MVMFVRSSAGGSVSRSGKEVEIRMGMGDHLITEGSVPSAAGHSLRIDPSKQYVGLSRGGG